jgi:DNA replication protein DnaC
MGMKQLPKRSGEYLFEIVMRRYETRSTVMTSNHPLEDWVQNRPKRPPSSEAE